MTNHVHIVAAPRKAASLALARKRTHGRFTSYWNVANCSPGHLWQRRYHSSPLDEYHLWEALRYTELNPVRAGMFALAEQWAVGLVKTDNAVASFLTHADLSPDVLPPGK